MKIRHRLYICLRLQCQLCRRVSCPTRTAIDEDPAEKGRREQGDYVGLVSPATYEYPPYGDQIMDFIYNSLGMEQAEKEMPRPSVSKMILNGVVD